jgi:hypothetical protein
LAGKGGDYEPATWNETDEALTPQGQETLAHRGVADTDRLSDGLEAEEVARSHRARDDEFPHVRSHFLGKLLSPVGSFLTRERIRRHSGTPSSRLYLMSCRDFPRVFLPGHPS